MIIPELYAPKTLAPPTAAHIIVAKIDFALNFPRYQKILRTALLVACITLLLACVRYYIRLYALLHKARGAKGPVIRSVC